MLLPALLLWVSVYAYNINFFLFLLVTSGAGIWALRVIGKPAASRSKYVAALIPVLILLLGKMIAGAEKIAVNDPLNYALQAGEKRFFLIASVKSASREILPTPGQTRGNKTEDSAKRYSTLLQGELVQSQQGLWLPTQKTILLLGGGPALLPGERITAEVKIFPAPNRDLYSREDKRAAHKIPGRQAREQDTSLTQILFPEQLKQQERILATLVSPVKTRQAPQGLASFSAWVKEQYAQLLQDFPYLASLGSAILLGQKENLPLAWQDDFKAAGVYHLVCLSGMHVGILLSILQFLPLRTSWRILFTVLALLSYVGIVGPSPSLLRASSMGVIASIGLGLNRGKNALNALLVSVIIWIFVNPNLVYDYGFILSVLATYVILIRARKNQEISAQLYGYLRRRLPDTGRLSYLSGRGGGSRAGVGMPVRNSKNAYPSAGGKPRGRPAGPSLVLADKEKWGQAAINAILTTTTVQLCCYPIMLQLRGGINPFSVPANFLSAPLLPVLMWISLGGCIWAGFRGAMQGAMQQVADFSFTGGNWGGKIWETLGAGLEYGLAGVDWVLKPLWGIGDFCSFLLVEVARMNAHIWILPWPQGQAGGILFLGLLGAICLLMLEYSRSYKTGGEHGSEKAQLERCRFGSGGAFKRERNSAD